MKKPLILVTNDDGITSRGIRILVELMQELGQVVVVAPDSPQSGMGHAITVANTLRMFETDIFEGLKAYKCSGTPADCVKLAKHHVFDDHRPDLVVSGINHGSNTSISVLYSGTMSAAIEAAIEEIPSIGFSLCDYSPNADFDHIKKHILKITRLVLEKGLPKGSTLNVNLPARNQEPVKGIKLCRQARAKWQEQFDLRYDPHGQKYFWLAGEFVNLDQGEDNDEWAIKHNYVSVVPCQFDLTNYNTLDHLNSNWKEEL